MVQDAPVDQPLGRTGHLAALHQNIVSAGGLRLQPQTLQRRHNRPREALHGQPFRIAHVGDEGVIQIAHIVIDRAAAGTTAHHADMVLLHKGGVDLLGGILVAAHHNGVVVLPEKQVLPFSAMGQDIFFKCQIIGGIGGPGLHIGHFAHIAPPSCLILGIIIPNGHIFCNRFLQGLVFFCIPASPDAYHQLTRTALVR